MSVPWYAYSYVCISGASRKIPPVACTCCHQPTRTVVNDIIQNTQKVNKKRKIHRPFCIFVVVLTLALHLWPHFACILPCCFVCVDSTVQ